MELDIFGSNKDRKEYYSEDYNFYNLYEKKFIVRTIVGKLANLFSNAALSDESGKETKLLEKLKSPNKDQSTEEFMRDFAINLFVSGYSIIWKKYESYGDFESLELIVISTDQDVTSVGKKSITTDYKGKSKTIDFDDLIILYDTQRKRNSLEGVSRLRPFKTQIDNITDAQTAINIQIENSGTTVVSPKSSTNANNIDEGLNAPVPTLGGGLKTQKEEMEDKLNSRGIRNRIIVSNKGLDAKNLSAELNSMNFSDMVVSNALSLYDLYSFDPELSPYGKNATFENKPSAENKVIESEIISLSRSLARSINQEFEAYGDIKISYDHLNSVATTKNKVVDVKKTVSDTYISLYKDGLIDRDEARKQLISNGIIE